MTNELLTERSADQMILGGAAFAEQTTQYTCWLIFGQLVGILPFDKEIFNKNSWINRLKETRVASNV